MFPFQTEYNDLIEKTDDDNTVQLYSFKECTRDSPSLLKEYRGVAYAGNRLLFRSYGFTPEYTTDELDRLTEDHPFSNYRFFRSEEGTLLRVFYVEENQKWYLSTHRKLDAFKSRWGNASNFGELFLDVLQTLYTDVSRIDLWEFFVSKLDKGHVYFFLLRNTKDNRIVCNAPPQPTFYHIGTMVENGTKYVMVNEDLPKQEELYFSGWQEVIDYVKSINPLETQGVIAIDADGKQVKILNKEHVMYTEVRGNEPSILYRYLHIRKNPEMVKKIHLLYPEYVKMFMEKESIIMKVCGDIHKAYLSRYVYKKYTMVPKEEYRIMKDSHAWHQQDYKKNKVTLPVISDMISRELFIPGLFSILKRLEK